MPIRLAALMFVTFTLGAPGLARAQLVAAGPYHTIVVDSNGTAWAWGLNTYGQLGDNTQTMRKTPVQVQNLTSVIAVAAGMYHSFALTSDGTVWAWGRNNTRQLGDGGTTDRKVPVAILTGMAKIAAGDDHGLAIDTSGTVWVWGANGSGQLGTGNTSVPNSPVTLTTPTGMVAIAGGSNFSVAVKSDGTVWSWGSNANGQLGNGSTTSSTSPVQATGITTATAVAAGTCHALILKSTGTLSAVGCNSNGRLGDGTTTTPRTSYVAVSAVSNAVGISAADRHSVAIDGAGSVWTWGFNGSSQLGDGGTTSRSTPATIGGIANVTRIGAGGSHNVAVTSSGVVYGWGVNNFGQIGDGTDETRSIPTAISEANFAFKAGVPILNPPGASSTYTTSITVTASSATPSVTMRYSTDGSEPTEAHQLYSGPITVDATIVLKIKAWHATLAPSNVGVGVFTLKPVMPTVTPSGGTYTSAQTVSMSTTTSNSTIRYTTDGSTPTASSPAYSSPLSVSSPSTIKAVAFRTGWTASDVRTANFSFSNYQPAVSSASPGAGTYHLVPVVVSFGTTEPNSDVRYSLTASATPTTLTPQPVELHKTTTISHRVRIVQPNGTVTYGPTTYTTYTVKVATPAIALAPGEYTPGTVIELTAATPSAVLRYRLDGQTPTDSDPIVPSDGKLMVGNFTLAVRGFYKDMDPSDVVTAAYTLPWLYSRGALVGGGSHSVALRPDGVVLTWGSNTWRQLGFGERRILGYGGVPAGEITVEEQLTPYVAGVTGVIAVAVGNAHNVALRNDGTVLTWGNDNAIGTTAGVLGRPNCNLEFHNSNIRSCIRPDSVGLTDIVAIAAGFNHTLALDSDGEVWAWGNNASGQVGNGTTSTQATPVQVSGLSNIVEIAASRDHSLARDANGVVWGWGSNEFRQIGDGTVPYEQTTPIEIEDFEGATSIRAGGYMAMAQMSDGTLWVRGRWGAGQLGNGTTNANAGNAAGQPIGLGEVATFAAGSQHVLVTTPSGELWAWGYNTNGELGNPAWGNTTVPGEVPDAEGIRAVDAGSMHSLAIAQDGSGWAWGNNTDGQVGDGTTVEVSTPFEVLPAGTFSCDVECAYVTTLYVDGNAPPTPHVTAPSTEVVVTVENVPGNPLDWVGLYAVGAPDDEELQWTYLNGSPTTPPDMAPPSADVPFTLPATEGAYEFRFFAGSGSGRIATSTQVITTCVTAVSKQTMLLESGATVETVDVTAPEECEWTAQAVGDFVEITEGASGTGDGSVNVAVDSNTTNEVRFAEIVVAGSQIAVVQSGGVIDSNACSITVSAHVDTNDEGAFELTAPNDCTWTVAALNGDVDVSPAEGTGTSSVPYTLDPGWAPALASDLSIGAVPTTFSATSFTGRICISVPIMKAGELPRWVQICGYPKTQTPPSQELPAQDPTLFVTPNISVQRGTSITLGIANAAGGTISGWRYEPPAASLLQPFVRTTNTGSPLWSGTVFVDGVARVTVRRNGRTFNLSLPITVVPRSTFVTPPVAAIEVLGNTIECPPGTYYTMPVPIVNAHGAMGYSCLFTNMSWTSSAVVATGPNQGGRFVDGFTDLTAYRWMVNLDLADTLCQFYVQQTGTYPGNPIGTISGVNLLANVRRHEAGPSQSHYSQYVAALANPDLNFGQGVESLFVGPPGSQNALSTSVNSVFNARRAAVETAFAAEPLGPNVDANNNFQGFINYTSYTGCHP